LTRAYDEQQAEACQDSRIAMCLHAWFLVRPGNSFDPFFTQTFDPFNQVRELEPLFQNDLVCRVRPDA
jgi:hypothetical protein